MGESITSKKRASRRLARSVLLAGFLMLILAFPAWANEITRLTATDAPGSGQTVTVQSQVVTSERLFLRSNIYYEILAPDGVTVVATHFSRLPRLEEGEQYDDSWSVSNENFPSVCTYTVTACWSRFLLRTCELDYKETTFYSVPTLGWMLAIAGTVLVVYFLWRQRGILMCRVGAHGDLSKPNC
jgi:hypothetical protein